MPTLVMFASPLLYEGIYKSAELIEYRLPNPIPNFLDKPIYYNEDNRPHDQIIDRTTGEPIDPTKIIIIDGPKKYTKEEEAMIIHNYAKKIFLQWVEIAASNEIERIKHVSDEVWEIMSSEDPPTPPGPVTGKPRGSVQARFVEKVNFLIYYAQLLTEQDSWYVLYDSGPDE